MEGIYSTTVNRSTIDRSPMAYKPMDEIIENIRDTVEITDIKPIYTTLRQPSEYRVVYSIG